MELFLNLCWLSLVLPACLLWRRRAVPGHGAGNSLAFVGALACALILLFPVISASDDLHAAPQALEESKRSLCHGASRTCPAHGGAFALTFLVPASTALSGGFEPVGDVLWFSPHSPAPLFSAAFSGRAPPPPASVTP